MILLNDWTPRVHSDGRVLFVNEASRQAQWEHPVVGKRFRADRNLPFGWERVVLESDQVLFVNMGVYRARIFDVRPYGGLWPKWLGPLLHFGRTCWWMNDFTGHLSKQTTYHDPRLDSAQPEGTVGAMAELRQKFDANSTADDVLADRSLIGSTVLITGGTSGIGSATVRALAKRGAHVVFTGRNTQAGGTITRSILLESPGSQVDFIPLDLSSLEKVRYFAERLIAKELPLNILILNAAAFGSPYSGTADGYESMFQTNVLSQLYLLILLKPLLVANAPSRIVFVSSESHRASSISIHSLTESVLSPPHRSYSAWTQYNNSKLCQILLSNYLQEHWSKEVISFYAVHPGNMISTGITRTWWVWKLVFGLVLPFTKSVDQGAATTVYCATAPELAGEGGKYWNNCWMCEPASAALDKPLAAKLWSLCNDMIAAKISSYKVPD